MCTLYSQPQTLVKCGKIIRSAWNNNNITSLPDRFHPVGFSTNYCISLVSFWLLVYSGNSILLVGHSVLLEWTQILFLPGSPKLKKKKRKKRKEKREAGIPRPRKAFGVSSVVIINTTSMTNWEWGWFTDIGTSDNMTTHMYQYRLSPRLLFPKGPSPSLFSCCGQHSIDRYALWGTLFEPFSQINGFNPWMRLRAVDLQRLNSSIQS